MRSFVQQYISTALTDPASSWQQLSPRFQQDCCDGSVGSYAGYWNTIATATLRDIRADPEQMEVSYTITWDPEGERPPEDEFVTLGLVQVDGRYLIDYEL
jgi:eukaryotic-like serine/threonine-protein kinase